jgi:uncharacterized protein YprB with RNaseH-like and TPR domain
MVAPDRERLRAALLRRADAAARHEEHDLRAQLQRRLERELGRRPVVALPDGEDAHNELGTYWRRLLRYPLQQRHGDVTLGAACDLDGARLCELSRGEQFGALQGRDCLFLDTETTGLAGGAGTVVFAVGLAWFEPDALVFEQLFLRDFGEEPAMLAAVVQRLQQRPVPVSFVGKSFDRHRIAARLAVHKLQAPILTERHLDLYYLARRAFGRELPDCRLRTVEERRLGVWRTDDLPGSEAPFAFLQWLRDRTGAVDRVLEHNRLDVLSVAALLGVLAGR